MHTRRILCRCVLLAALGGLLLAGAAFADDRAVPSGAVAYRDQPALALRLWTRNPDVLEARTAVSAAAAELLRARTYPNPTLDAAWGTIPVGATNPKNLPDPIDQVPNYT